MNIHLIVLLGSGDPKRELVSWLSLNFQKIMRSNKPKVYYTCKCYFIFAHYVFCYYFRKRKPNKIFLWRKSSTCLCTSKEDQQVATSAIVRSAGRACSADRAQQGAPPSDRSCPTCPGQ